MDVLFLRLEAPLQSWGERAYWGERDTNDAPTKSGVIGLLGCALGIYRESDDLRVLFDSLVMGVRIDRPGTIICDYHTVGAARAPDGKPEGRRQSDGTLKRDGGMITKRYYLSDASFLVAVGGDHDLIRRLAYAVQNPVWPYYLGRRSCPPSCPVFAGTGEYDGIIDALTHAPMTERTRNEHRTEFQIIYDAPPGTDGGQWRRNAIQVPSHRRFRRRYECTGLVNTFE
jgi:CRISPR system Cascade subunit CasD